MTRESPSPSRTRSTLPRLAWTSFTSTSRSSALHASPKLTVPLPSGRIDRSMTRNPDSLSRPGARADVELGTPEALALAEDDADPDGADAAVRPSGKVEIATVLV